MSQEFDPYFKWLKIPPSEQPPNHYRLLNLARFESDKDVIESAVAKLVTLLQNVSTGDKAEHAQRILNDVAKARLCLSDPQRKAKYDHQLKQSLVGATKQSSIDRNAPRDSSGASKKRQPSGNREMPSGKSVTGVKRPGKHRKTSVPGKKSGKAQRRKKSSSTGLIVAYGFATLLVFGGALFVLFYTLNQRVADKTQAAIEASFDEGMEEDEFESAAIEEPQPEPNRASEPELNQAKIPSQAVEKDIAEADPPPIAQTPKPKATAEQPAVATVKPPVVPKAMPAESSNLLPQQLQRFEAQLGEMVEFEGVPISARASSSGKTRYLHFTQDWDDSIMVFMWTRDVGDDLTVADLQKFVGQTIRVNGVVERQFGTNRLGVKIQAKDQIEIMK